MKKLSYFIVLLFAAGAVFTACDNDPKEPDVLVTGVSLNKDTLELAVGSTERLTAVITPANATNQAVSWTSSNTAIAAVNNNGVVTARAVGTAVITVKTACGGHTDSVNVTVIPAPIPVTDISLNKTALTLAVGDTETLIAAIMPEDATNKTVTWTSSSNAVATVDADGVVTAVSAGTAVITAQAGEVTASCTVTVFTPGQITDEGVVIAGIRWATRNVDMPGTFARNPEDAGMLYQWNRRIGWSSTNPMVNSNGGTTWDNSFPQGTAWYAENDPCPPGWRVPTVDELHLLRNSGHTWTTQNGINGRLFGTAPYQIFLPAAGNRSGTTNNNGALFSVGSGGDYWSNVRSQNLSFWGSDVRIFTTNTRYGYSIRCVAN